MKPTKENCYSADLEKQPEKFDVIVAGAGMGGLTSASLPAHDGLKVLLHFQLHP